MSNNEQDALPAEGMPDEPGTPTRITFVGMKLESVAEEFKIGDEHEFKVSGRCVGAGDEEMHDGHLRRVAKFDVSQIKPLTYDEPTPVKVISPDGDRDDIGTDGGDQ